MGFRNGERLKSIHFAEDQVLTTEGPLKTCDAITVVLENGPMAQVPWFEVWEGGQLLSKWNATACEGVSYVTTKKQPPLVGVSHITIGKADD